MRQHLLVAILVSFGVHLSAMAEETRTIFNPISGRPDFITKLSTSSIKAGSGVTVTTTTAGVEISASGGSGVSVYPATSTANFPFALDASTITLRVDDSAGGPGITYYNDSSPTGLGYFPLATIYSGGSLLAKHRFRAWSAGNNGRGFIWGDSADSEGMKFDTTNSRLHVLSSSGTATLNILGSALIGSGVIGKSPDPDGLRVSGTSVFESSISVQGQSVCLEDGTNCPSSSGGVAGSTAAITMVFDGGGSAISSGVEASTTCVTIPFAATISSWTALVPHPSASGSISVTIRKASYSDYPTFTEMSSGGNPPSITSSSKNAAAVASWSSASISQGDVVCGEVTSATTLQRAVVTLWAVRQ